MARKIAGISIMVLISFSLFGQTTKSALFLGNSYTASNNLPNLVSELALSVNDSLIYDSNTPGGHRLMGHAANATSIAKIYSRNWDYVALQAQSQEPSWAEWQVIAEVFPYAKILCDTIRDNNSCTEPLFFMTWGRENGDSFNCSNWPPVCTYEGMDSILNQNYRIMGETNRTAVSPVGAVWNYLRANSTIDLYSSDGSHPSQAGSYAAAVTFYTMIFEKAPTLLSYNYSLNTTDAQTIKDAVGLIVYDSLWVWSNDQYYINQLGLEGCDSVDYNGTYYSSNVTIYDTLPNANIYGCDSVINTNITVHNPVLTSENVTLCLGQNYTYPDGTSVVNIDSAVTYQSDLVSTITGCDSIISTNISLVLIDTTASLNGATLTSNEPLADSYQWIDCTNGNAPIPGAISNLFNPSQSGNYAAQITIGGCTATSSCYEVVILDIKDVSASKAVIDLYPNPTSGLINLRVTNINSRIWRYELFDTVGRLLDFHEVNDADHYEILLPEDNGIYYLTVYLESGVYSFKIIHL